MSDLFTAASVLFKKVHSNSNEVHHNVEKDLLFLFVAREKAFRLIRFFKYILE